MSKVTVILSLVFVYTCCVFCDSGAGGSPVVPVGGSSVPSSPSRKVRILSPAMTKLYRLLRSANADDEDLFQDDESYFQKRQYDDYGHMRFGKRNPKDFDDYGHMRFGK